jgi:hypothetical protein
MRELDRVCGFERMLRTRRQATHVIGDRLEERAFMLSRHP